MAILSTYNGTIEITMNFARKVDLGGYDPETGAGPWWVFGHSGWAASDSGAVMGSVGQFDTALDQPITSWHIVEFREDGDDREQKYEWRRFNALDFYFYAYDQLAVAGDEFMWISYFDNVISPPDTIYKIYAGTLTNQDSNSVGVDPTEFESDMEQPVFTATITHVVGGPFAPHTLTIVSPLIYNGEPCILMQDGGRHQLFIVAADGSMTQLNTDAVADAGFDDAKWVDFFFTGSACAEFGDGIVRRLSNPGFGAAPNQCYAQEFTTTSSTVETFNLGADPNDTDDIFQDPFNVFGFQRIGDRWVLGLDVAPIFPDMPNRILMFNQNFTEWWDVQLVAGDATAALIIPYIAANHLARCHDGRVYALPNTFGATLEDSNSEPLQDSNSAPTDYVNEYLLISSEPWPSDELAACSNPVTLPASCDPAPDDPDILWPFRPNWGRGVDMTREFKTDIMTSRGGQEQRRALRTEARRTIEFENVFANAAQLREFERLLVLNQTRRWLVPNWTHNVVLTAAIAAGTVPAVFDEEPDWFEETDTVVLHAGSRVALATVTKDSNSLTGVTITTDLAWPIGTKMYPALPAYAETEINSSRETNAVGVARLSFSVDPGEFEVEPTGTPETIFNDREVWPFTPNWARSIGVENVWDRDEFDAGYGVIDRRTRVDSPKIIRQMEFAKGNAADVRRIDRFFMRHYGQAREFYMETGQFDVVLSAGWSTTDDILTVAGTDFGEAYANAITHRAIKIVLVDGTVLYKAIADITPTSSESIISLVEPMDTTVALEDIERIAWLHVTRFATDDMTLRWVTQSVAVCQTSFCALEDLPPDQDGADSNSNSATG